MQMQTHGIAVLSPSTLSWRKLNLAGVGALSPSFPGLENTGPRVQTVSAVFFIFWHVERLGPLKSSPYFQ